MFGISVSGYVIALGLAMSGGLGWWAGSSIKQGEWDAKVLGQREGEDAALKAAAEAIAKIEVKSEKHVYPVRTEIRTNTVYRECKHSDDSLRNLNSLIQGTEPTGTGILPGAKTSR